MQVAMYLRQQVYNTVHVQMQDLGASFVSVLASNHCWLGLIQERVALFHKRQGALSKQQSKEYIIAK